MPVTAQRDIAVAVKAFRWSDRQLKAGDEIPMAEIGERKLGILVRTGFVHVQGREKHMPPGAKARLRTKAPRRRTKKG